MTNDLVGQTTDKTKSGNSSVVKRYPQASYGTYQRDVAPTNSTDCRFQRALAGNPIVDQRKGDRHKQPRSRSRKTQQIRNHKESKWERRNIVAWDGEGANLNSGIHVYNLLANSEGAKIINHEGLSTKECFDFYLEHSQPTAINIIFGGSYDVNMMLRDVPKEQLFLLWTTGSTFWHDYRIFYTPRKKFTVQRHIQMVVGGKRKTMIKTFTLWDVIGFYQSSFVVACRKWLGELPILDEIEGMKLQRSTFDVAYIDEIVEYNRKECILLVQLMEALFDALDIATIQLRRYDGAGAIATALFSYNNVVTAKGSPDSDTIMYARIAYSGGRIEAPKVGNAENCVIYRYDINSAYPSIMVNLPSYYGATWRKEKEWDGSDNSMVHIRWHFTEERPFYPLWYREHDGTILYPRTGEGVYWGSEIRNLIDWPDGCEYEILDVVNVTLSNDTKPFRFVQDTYSIRLMFKEQASMASEALKLGINSLYGKLAQQAGYRSGRIPRYHQLLWAGQVTAGARAQMYRAAMQAPDKIIAFATDALISLVPLDVLIGTKLGEWTHDSFDGITIVQPGVYWLKDGTGSWAEKYRGFDKGSLMRQHIVSSWLLGQDYTAHLTRFIGMGTALMSTDFAGIWRTWSTDPRTLSLQPGGKREAGTDVCFWDHLCDTLPSSNTNGEGVISYPYPLLWGVDREQIKRLADEIDIDEMEKEYLDSYA